VIHRFQAIFVSNTSIGERQTSLPVQLLIIGMLPLYSNTCLPLTPKSNKYWFSRGLRFGSEAFSGAIFETRDTSFTRRYFDGVKTSKV
jgi:hypothetical protein